MMVNYIKYFKSWSDIIIYISMAQKAYLMLGIDLINYSVYASGVNEYRVEVCIEDMKKKHEEV